MAARRCATAQVRYARWDLGRVDLVDPQQGTILAPLCPLDRQANADGHRYSMHPPIDKPPAIIANHLTLITSPTLKRPRFSIYKRVFAHREMVEDLLRGFVREPWVAEVEMDTLERVSGSYVSDDLRAREDDIIWRVRWRDRWLYVYLLLEFQATVDSFMALRILVYVGLLYQDLVREKKLTAGGRLPPVLPLVLYSGEEGWTAATEISELIESVPGGMDRYRPQMRYLLVEERGFSDAELAPMRNLVAALFRLENSRGPEDIIQVLELLIEWLRAPEQADLARALVVWLRRSLLASRMPDIDIPEIENLQEARTMLAERVKDWKKQWQEEARKEGETDGWKEGEKEGRKAGESTILIELLTHKFGAIDAHTRRQITDGSSEQLQNWAERILTADKIEEVFD